MSSKYSGLFLRGPAAVGQAATTSIGASVAAVRNLMPIESL
jgi:hypothetical protein